MTKRERIIFMGALMFGGYASKVSHAWFAHGAADYIAIIIAVAIATGLMIYLRADSVTAKASAESSV